MLSNVTGNKTRFPLRSTPRGFALVMTLVLMSLLLILVLAMAALIRNETPSITAQMNLAEARHHALSGLGIAIGELQQSAGPDQRVTARADLLDSDAATPAIDDVTQPYWTGAWTTGDAHLDVGPNPQRTTSLGGLNPTQAQKSASAAWLVSRDPNGTALSPIDFTGGQVMAREWGPNAVDVEVPLIEIVDDQGTPGTTDDVTLGTYAYWVSDEGVKARADLVDADFDSSSLTRSARQLRRWSPGANAMQEIFPLSTGVDDFRESDPNDVAKLSLPGQVALLPAVDRAALELKDVLPDFTVHSSGVLADVRNGGLKKDLTAAFENEADFRQFASDNGKGNNMLFRTSQDSWSPREDGPYPDPGSFNYNQIERSTDGMLWDPFFYFYNIYKQSIPSAETTSLSLSGMGDPDASFPYTLQNRVYCVSYESPSGASASPGVLDVVPHVLSFRIEAAVSSYLDGSEWKLRIHYYPQLVLYNPYTVRLASNGFQITKSLNLWNLQTNGRHARQDVSVGAATETVSMVDATGLDDDEVTTTFRTAPGQTDILEPGETRVYGLAASIEFTDTRDALTFELVSTSGMSADFNHYLDFSTLTTTNGADEVTITPAGGSSVVDSRSFGSALNFDAAAEVGFPLSYPRFRFHEYSVRRATVINWAPVAISSMGGNPRYLLGIFNRKKGVSASGDAGTYLHAAHAPPLFMGNNNRNFSVIYPTDGLSKEAAAPEYGDPYNSGLYDFQIQPAGSFWETSWGSDSVGAASPGNRRVLVDLPSSPMVSLGQFTHLIPRFDSVGEYGGRAYNHLSIGGSYSSPKLFTTEVSLEELIENRRKRGIDESFMANQALFDRYFLSTVPPADLTGGTAWPEAWVDFNTANSGTTLTDPSLPLLNPRIRPRQDRRVSMAELRDADTAAANLMLQGAFNVNSTSVPAWKAFLKTHSNNPIELYHTSGSSPGSVTIDPGDDVLISRFWSATGASAPNQPWSGVRTLDDDQVTELAESIVEQVKLRGPFLSMGDFLNRRQGPNGPLTRSGALQAALDRTDINDTAASWGEDINVRPGDPVDIESSYKTGSGPRSYERAMVGNPDFNEFRDADGNLLSTSVGMPGYLMQQDLVMQYVPAMTARSDTFVIRCYGETRNKVNGSIEARAWGEAVVQRIPEYVDDADAPEVAPADLTSTANQNFGRRYVIKEFRWLNQDEI